jgi:3'(2'), 5'-bisphosphate nucleotidase
MQRIDYRHLVRELTPVALAAGAAIMRHYRSGVATEYKDNWSPVTAADREAEAIILEGLARVLPGVPVIAEEEAAAGRIPRISGSFVLVDPLDGTREFIEERDEFTVNIALVEERRPAFGLVYAPATALLYVTGGRGEALAGHAEPLAGAPLPSLVPIRVRKADPAGLTALASRSHLDVGTKALLARFRIASLANAGSSLKFCVLARGDADLYPRLGPTMEWDTAAGHAVLAAAGGAVAAPDGGPFLYGKADAQFRNGGFIAWGDPELARGFTV